MPELKNGIKLLHKIHREESTVCRWEVTLYKDGKPKTVFLPSYVYLHPMKCFAINEEGCYFFPNAIPYKYKKTTFTSRHGSQSEVTALFIGTDKEKEVDNDSLFGCLQRTPTEEEKGTKTSKKRAGVRSGNK